ncbi:MAG TPA: hypothetical protein VF622_05540 [Segetibacter sp.]|jgi:hypothetical protein
MLFRSFFSPPYTVDKKVKLGVLFYFIVMVIVAFVGKGTGDEGDSISHYLYAKTAWTYKHHFLDHWAKPVYVLVAFPFAQFGLIGVKVMNVLLNCGSLFFTYKVAKALKFSWSWVPPILLASTPMFNHLSLSGLTEPLCAFMLIAGLFLLIQERWIAGIVLLSFLPFVRSEGLLMLSVVFVYLVYNSKYQFLPLLATGHVFYSLVGYFYHKDLLWVFNKMTYATWSSAYGQGRWTHYFKNLSEILGSAGMVLFYFALLYGFVLMIRFLRRQVTGNEKAELFLIYGSLFIYFAAHSAFWALGIFNSGGILRVMISIMPLFALVNYRAIEYLFAFVDNMQWRKRLMAVVVAILFLYPFSGHLFAYRWKRDFSLKADQYAQVELKQWLTNTFPDYRKYTFYYEAVYLSEILNIDWFNSTKRKRLLDAFTANEFKSGDFVIWDDWFAVVEGHIALESLEKDQRLEKLRTFQRMDYWGKTRTTVVFRFK